MKIQILSIIMAITTVAIALAFLFISQFQHYFSDSKEFEITDLNPKYKQGDLVTITTKYEGEKFDCHSPKIEVTNKTKASQVFASVEEQSNNVECPNSWSLSFYPGFDKQIPQSISEKGLSYIASVTLGEKTIRKEFTVFPDPGTHFFTDVQINDSDKPHYVGDVINFTISVLAHGVLDAGQEPEVEVRDAHGATMWNSQQHIVLCCVIELTSIKRDIPLSTLGDPLKIDHGGKYTIFVTYASKTVQKTFDILLPEITCKQISINNSTVDLKKFTWIAISQIQQPFKEECVDVGQIIKKNNLLQQVIQGADDCQKGTIQCSIPKGIGSSVVLDNDLFVNEFDQYKQSLSQEEAKLFAKELGIILDGKPTFKVLKHDDKYYLLFFYTTDENVDAEAIMEFAKPIYSDPIKIEKGRSINYTILVNTLSTFGKPADVKLYSGISASDSLVSVKVEPSDLIIPERSQENATLTITASKDARDGIYTVFLYGKSGEGLIGPYNHMNLPIIQVGDSNWKIRTYGQESSAGIGGYKPIKNIWAELELNKEKFERGDVVEIKAYLVNNSTNRIIMDEDSRLYVQVIKTSDFRYYDNLYGIEAISESGKQIVLEPHSRTLLVRPFYWDQNTSFGDGHSERLEPKKYKMLMSFGSYNGTVWDDEVWFEIR